MKTFDNNQDAKTRLTASGDYAGYVTDFEIIRDKIDSIRQDFIGNNDHLAMSIEAELCHAQQRMEDALRHVHATK